MKQQVTEVKTTVVNVVKNTGPMFLACIVILILAAFQGYLFFHTLAELFAIIVAALVSVVAWQTYKFSKNHYLMFIGCGYAWVAALDLLHALSYKGMNLFPVDGANTATQLWVLGRLSESALLFIAPFFINRTFSIMKVNLAFALLVVGAVLCVFVGFFPDAFIENKGLTAFKINAEFIAIALFSAAILHLLIRCKQFESKVLTLICLSILATILSEFAFTLYVDVYGISNFVGHILKFLSYWIIFQAIASTTLKEPIKILNRSLTNEIEMRKKTERENTQLITQMAERIKELSCVYGVTEAISLYEQKEELLEKVVELLPSAWHYPEYSRAEIVFDGVVYGTSANNVAKAWQQSSLIKIDGDERGRVTVFYTKEFPELDEGPFMLQEHSLINGISASLGNAIARIESKEKIQHQATHDELTGLYNRKLIEKIIGKEISRASRYSRSFSLLMLDLDHFKQINDQYGHQVGDRVLQHAAMAIEEHVREVDHVGRYGGEEFLVTLPETTPDEAKSLAQRIVDAIADLKNPLEDGDNIAITVSIGVATCPDNAATIQALIQAADEAMYKAKSNGRNCVVCQLDN